MYHRFRSNRMRNKLIIRLCFFAAAAAAVILIVACSGKQIQAEETEDACKLYTSITIYPGDSLWSISTKYMDSHYRNVQEYIDELMFINNLSSDTINAYEHLLIPYYLS